MHGATRKAQQTPSTAWQQDLNDYSYSKQQFAHRSRQCRARGRVAGQAVCLTPTSSWSNSQWPVEIKASDVAWAKPAPTRMEAGPGQPPSRAYKHEETSLTYEGQMNADSPFMLADCPEGSRQVIEKLEVGSPTERHDLLMWLLQAIRKLALSKSGCRVVQKAIEVAGASERDLIITELKDHVVELCWSPFGNHVLSRAIEVMPSAKNDFVISALLGQGVIASKHRFGCRVVIRLIEHCPAEQIGPLLGEILVDVNVLARHAFGNFVVQSVLEHVSGYERSFVLSQILPSFATLAAHRSGSLVAQKALTYCRPEEQAQAIRAFLQPDENLISLLVLVACNHYGSFVIEQLADMSMHPEVQEIAQTLAASLSQLHLSDDAEKVLVAFGLPLASVENCSDA